MTRRLLAAVAALAFLAAPATAWQIRKAPPSYVGPGDLVTFTAFYSCSRAYTAAYAAAQGNLCDLRRVSDNATCTLKAATDGTADVATGLLCNGNTQTVTDWIGASSARVSRQYDQTAGNACTAASCDVLQATAAAQPLLVLSGCGANSRACLEQRASETIAVWEMVSANNFTPSSPLSLSVVGNRTSGTSSGYYFIVVNQSGAVPTVNSLVPQVANKWQCHNVTVTANDAAWHSANCAMTTGASTGFFNLDGSEFTFSPTVNTDTGRVRSPHMQAAQVGTIRIGETGFASAAWSLADRAALCTNQYTFYGTSVSC